MEELWSLTSFFGYSTQTFVQAVNLLDRFLTIMKVAVLLKYNLLFHAMHVCVYAICAESMRLTLFDFHSRDVDSHLVPLC